MHALTAIRPIRVRNFPSLPDAAQANTLLYEIAATPSDQRPRLVDKPLALYGAGDMGHLARDYLSRIGITVDFVVDRNADRLSGSEAWRDTQLVKPDDVPLEARQSMLLAVCIATIPYAPLEAELIRAGWHDVVPFYDIAEAYRDRHPLSNGWIAPPLDEQDVAGISTVLGGWDDDRSRACHLQFLAWRRLREEWTFADAPVTVDDRYFIPEVRTLLTDHEAFADIGAHEGRAIQRFLDVVKGFRGPIWAVEPDRINLSCLRQTVESLSRPDIASIKIIPKAVAAAEGAATFAEGMGYASQLSELGKVSLPVTTIDRLGIEPSFLKLHLEGGELAALQGAQRTLARSQPLLAVTSYHNSQGIWELPLWLMETLPSYRFLMRLHSWVGTGAVIYGISQSRDDRRGQWQCP